MLPRKKSSKLPESALNFSKPGIIDGSVVSGILGLAVLNFFGRTGK
jgi:hypothetical protein